MLIRKRCDPLDRFSRNDTTRNKIRKSRVHDGIDRITEAVENRDYYHVAGEQRYL